MQIDITKNENFSMHYTTRSGKHLSLSMYDKQSLSYTGGQSLNLKHQYGFSFSFEGSKLSQDDLKEIQNAMREVEPMIEDFLANSKVGTLRPRQTIQAAMQMAGVLPMPKDENHQNAIMNHFTNKLSTLLKENQTANKHTNASMLEDSKKLLDAILEQMRKELQKQREQIKPLYA